MPSDKTRVVLYLDQPTEELLKRIEELTGASPSKTVAKLLGAHRAELWEFEAWLSKTEPGSRERELGVHLIDNYGPDDLFAAIRRIDPGHRFAGDEIRSGAGVSAADVEELRNALAELRKLRQAGIQARE